MRLSDVVRNAEQILIEEGNPDEILHASSATITSEVILETLWKYANLCHKWGPEYGEELALRKLVASELNPKRKLAATQLLLDRLLNRATGEETDRATLLEANSLACFLIENELDHVKRSEAIGQRGRVHLELARLGETEFALSAQSDFQEYGRFLESDQEVPSHWNIITLTSFLSIELAETYLLLGNPETATELLENAIETLEDKPIASWATEHAYTLLNRCSRKRRP